MHHFCYVSQMAATTRNVFIANLAMADLLLCLFTIPLTLIDLVNKYWGLAPGMVRLSKIQESKLMYDKAISKHMLRSMCASLWRQHSLLVSSFPPSRSPSSLSIDSSSSNIPLVFRFQPLL